MVVGCGGIAVVGAAARVVGGAAVTAGALVVAGAWSAVVVGGGLVEAGTLDVELAVVAAAAPVLTVVATSAPELPPVVPVRVLLALLPHATTARASPITTMTANP